MSKENTHPEPSTSATPEREVIGYSVLLAAKNTLEESRKGLATKLEGAVKDVMIQFREETGFTPTFVSMRIKTRYQDEDPECEASIEMIGRI